jgi:dipeptide/tripeptide permease
MTMKLTYFIALLSLTLILIGTFVYLCYRVYQSKTRTGGFTFVVLGMLIGSLSGFLAFFNLDHTKGWNPFGWWFIASFFAAIFGGLLGMVVYGFITNKRPKT